MDHLSTPQSCIVLDPFSGAGTVPLVARKLGRHGVGLDLNLKYVYQARKRLDLEALHAWEHGARPRPMVTHDLPLFMKKEEIS
jgi:site-specific DNA-methyltransferase (adenine-specific)